jgi:hypothetical protein
VLSSFGPWSLPTPILWGVIAAWIPIPPAVMAGVLCAVMMYALCHSLLSLRDWKTEPEPEPEYEAVLV